VRGKRDRDIDDAELAAREALAVIAIKWSAMVVLRLAHGRKRYSLRRREIGGILRKLLAQIVRHLQRHGLVERRWYPVLLPRAEYAQTPLRQSLIASQ
jgi:DNA-binding HxlR family transcriptional regulator